MTHDRETGDPSSSLSTIARANQLASECFTIALGMIIPGFFGYWCDSYFRSQPLFTLLGFTLGFGYGIWRLVLLGMRRQQNFVPTKPYNSAGLDDSHDEEDAIDSDSLSETARELGELEDELRETNKEF